MRAHLLCSFDATKVHTYKFAIYCNYTYMAILDSHLSHFFSNLVTLFTDVTLKVPILCYIKFRRITASEVS